MKVTLLLNSGERVVHADDIEHVTLSWNFEGKVSDGPPFGLTFGTDGEEKESGIIRLSTPDGDLLPEGTEFPEGLEEYDGMYLMLIGMS